MLSIGSKIRVGLDVGNHSIKAVVVERAGQRYKMLARAHRQIYSGTQKYNPDGPKRSQVVPLLVDLFKELKIQPKKQKDIRTLLAGLQVAAKEIIAIPLEEKEMASAMLLEARKHIPLDGSETQVDYMILGEDIKEPEKVRVLVVATTKKLFNAHLETLAELEIRPTIVEVESLAFANSYMAFNEMPDDGVVVILNIGCRKTSVTVVGRKDMFFSRELTIAGNTFTDYLMQIYGLKYQEAEKVKIEQGMNPDLPKVAIEGKGLRLASKGVIEQFGEEVNRTLRYYVKETSQSFFTKFVLVGGGAAMPDIQEYLENKFNVTVEAYDPFSHLEIIGGNGGGHPSQYAAAVGLAIQED
ncbi:MAG: type IV pilus assembly protein PilM [Candidatus Electryonea clarkiae]|nr:type IV pilus assembly protein PilM [Candidatus Electryonea clarkiae]MDP8288693.1 type IV pilus assembly protein PilM [Candidatus Electryonea clarkiae]